MKTHIIGAGGAGSFITPALAMLIGNENVCVVDGDKLERKNLNRQLFTEDDIGQFKAEALARKYGCMFLNEFFSFGDWSIDMDDWIICVVDNHPARAAVLEACDYHRCRCIIAANETHSSDAYVYYPEWRDTNLDPRIMFPEIVTDTSGDPRRAAIGCTGVAQEQNRQLVSANMMAASLALHLFVVWQMEADKLPMEVRAHLPHRLVQNLSRSESFKAQITTKVERTDNDTVN